MADPRSLGGLASLAGSQNGVPGVGNSANATISGLTGKSLTAAAGIAGLAAGVTAMSSAFPNQFGSGIGAYSMGYNPGYAGLPQTYTPVQVRDQSLIMIDRLHREHEKKIAVEIEELQQRFASNPSNSELKMLWGIEAKGEAQFAYMRRLIRTEGFVMRAMLDFDGLDTNGSGFLEPGELREFIKKRDGAQLKEAQLELRASDLLRDLDISRDGKVSRLEWLIYLAFLHWQSFLDENVVEKIIEITKEYKTDPKTNQHVMVESVKTHPPIPRAHRLAQLIGQNAETQNRVANMSKDNVQLQQGVQQGKKNTVERSHTESDGRIVTTIEHPDVRLQKGWCM